MLSFVFEKNWFTNCVGSGNEQKLVNKPSTGAREDFADDDIFSDRPSKKTVPSLDELDISPKGLAQKEGKGRLSHLSNNSGKLPSPSAGEPSSLNVGFEAEEQSKYQGLSEATYRRLFIKDRLHGLFYT